MHSLPSLLPNMDSGSREGKIGKQISGKSANEWLGKELRKKKEKNGKRRNGSKEKKRWKKEFIREIIQEIIKGRQEREKGAVDKKIERAT